VLGQCLRGLCVSTRTKVQDLLLSVPHCVSANTLCVHSKCSARSLPLPVQLVF
jgi:hypothetical protein